MLIIFNQFELLAEHFVDHSGKLSTEQAREIRPRYAEMRQKYARDTPEMHRSPEPSTGQIAAMLRRRARTKELSFDEYHTWLRCPPPLLF